MGIPLINKSEIVQYSTQGMKIGRVGVNHSTYSFSIHENHIYMCTRDDMMLVLDMSGKIIRTKSIAGLRDVNTLNDNIIIRTVAEIQIYSLEYDDDNQDR